MKTLKKAVKLNLNLNNQNKIKFLESLQKDYINYMREIFDYFYDVLLKEDFIKYTNLSNYNSGFPSSIIDIKHIKPALISGQLAKQAMNATWGIIRNKQMYNNRNKLYVIETLKSKGEDYSHIKIDYDIKKPEIKDDYPLKLSSTNVKIEEDQGSFDIVIKLNTLCNKEYRNLRPNNKMNLVFNSHKVYNKYKKLSLKESQSLSIFNGFVSVLFDIKQQEKLKNKKSVGIDQGFKSLISTVDTNGNSYHSSSCPHGHTIESICRKISKIQKGTKAFKRAQEHRTNHINYTINKFFKLNNDISSVHFEEVKNLNKGKSRNRVMQAWTYRDIMLKFESKCLDLNIKFVKENSVYKSQRCSECGFVHIDNRFNSDFQCLKCGYSDNADLNSARNQIQELYKFETKDNKILKNKNKYDGFYWYNDSYKLI